MISLALTAVLAAPSDPASLEARLQKELLAPMAALDTQTSKFSRKLTPPDERRVKVDSTVHSDSSGAYFTFVLEDRRGEPWRQRHEGCVYPGGDIFVKIGNNHFPSEVLTGDSTDPANGMCGTKKKPTVSLWQRVRRKLITSFSALTT